MSFKDLLFADIEKYILENETFTKKDLLAMVGNVYDANKKPVGKKLKLKNTDDNIKKALGKKIKIASLSKPSTPEPPKKMNTYQMFMKTTLKTLKEREDAKPASREKLTHKDLMKEVGELWKVEKDKIK